MCKVGFAEIARGFPGAMIARLNPPMSAWTGVRNIVFLFVLYHTEPIYFNGDCLLYLPAEHTALLFSPLLSPAISTLPFNIFVTSPFFAFHYNLFSFSC